MTTTEDRFLKTVREMDEQLTAAENENTELRSRLRIYEFTENNVGGCGKCGEKKFLCWRDDEHGYGYVCPTCLVAIKDEQIAELKDSLANEKLRDAGESGVENT